MKAKKPEHLKIRFEDKLRQKLARDAFIQHKSQGQIIREALYSMYNYDPKKDNMPKPISEW